MRGSDPLGERIGGGGSGPSSGGWVAFRSPAGPPRLERMYYDFASPSRLFRTNFLISFAGIAGTGKACRSQEKKPIVSGRTQLQHLCEMLYQELRAGALLGLRIVSHRHFRIRMLGTGLAQSAAEAGEARARLSGKPRLLVIRHALPSCGMPVGLHASGGGLYLSA
jgi:hypothetical protein